MATKKKVLSHDEMVQELYEKVQIKKGQIAQAAKPNWQTSCSFGYSADSANGRIDIKTISDTRKLQDIMGFLLDREENSQRGATALGLPVDTFKWLGFTVDEWKSDLITRVTQILLTTKKAELAKLESRLENLISPELKAKLELEAIKDLLNED